MKHIKLFESFLSTNLKNDNSSKPIILIGPQGTGKSTTAEALSKRLNIPLITTDMSMVDKKYEMMCKKEPGVEVEIKRHPTEGLYYSSNDKYVFCVLNKLLEEYGNKRIVLDVGGTHAYVSERLINQVKRLFSTITPYVFIFNVTDDEEESYEFLKARRQGRGEKTESPEQEQKVKKALNILSTYYKDIKKISVINPNKSSKTTDELVDEIIGNLV